jgi:hypothetical protein
MPSRVSGRGRILATWRRLIRMTERFEAHRASSEHERRWAGKRLDALHVAYAEALSAPGSRQALAAVDRRRAISRKTRERLLNEHPYGGQSPRSKPAEITTGDDFGSYGLGKSGGLHRP